MTRKRTILIGAFVLLSGASVAAAQVFVPGGFAPRWQQRQQEFIDSLSLNQVQVQTWQQTLAQQTEFQRGLATDLALLARRIEADLANPQADLRGLAAAIEDGIDRQIAAHRELRDARLDFYDTLNPEQQAQVRAHLLDRLHKLQRLRAALQDLAAMSE